MPVRCSDLLCCSIFRAVSCSILLVFSATPSCAKVSAVTTRSSSFACGCAREHTNTSLSPAASYFDPHFVSQPLSPAEFKRHPVSMLGDVDGSAFDPSEPNGEGRLAPGLDKTYTLGDKSSGHREFQCHSLQRDRDPVFGGADVQYVDTDQLNCYLEIGGTPTSIDETWQCPPHALSIHMSM